MQCFFRHCFVRFMAERVQDPRGEPHGSWRKCEKDSVSVVSRHYGGRCWNDLLGQCAPCPRHNPFNYRPPGTTTVFDARHNSVAADAVFAEPGRDRAVFTVSGFLADSRYHNTKQPDAAIGLEPVRRRFRSRCQRYADFLGNRYETGRQVRVEG